MRTISHLLTKADIPSKVISCFCTLFMVGAESTGFFAFNSVVLAALFPLEVARFLIRGAVISLTAAGS